MYNYNEMIADDIKLSVKTNRAFLYGDAVFETIKVSDGIILFLEDHYFRLMASMRILRMEIPMNYTMEYFEQQIFNLLNSTQKSISYKIRITIFRDSEGLYVPDIKKVSFLISSTPLENKFYTAFNEKEYEVELFKDFTINPQLLSAIKSTNKMIQITAGIFAKENGYDNCIILNSEKNVTEMIDSNIFMVIDNVIYTPPITDGCLNGIMRKQILKCLQKNENFKIEERSISPFELQKADELFITNTIKGIQPITKYRKKAYHTDVSQQILKIINLEILKLN